MKKKFALSETKDLFVHVKNKFVCKLKKKSEKLNFSDYSELKILPYHNTTIQNIFQHRLIHFFHWISSISKTSWKKKDCIISKHHWFTAQMALLS